MVIQKINSKYVGDDCIQIMLPYVNHDFMVLDNQGVIYVDSKGRHENHYLEDERRHNFPYSNRPIHKDKKYGVKLTFVNQLLDFEKPYITIDGAYQIQEIYVKKDGDLALFITNEIEPAIIDNQSDLKLETAQKLREQLISELYPNWETIFSNHTNNIEKNTNPFYHLCERFGNKRYSESYTFFTTINGEKITNLNGIHLIYDKENKYNLRLVNYPIIDYSTYALELLKKGAIETSEPSFKWESLSTYSPEIPVDKINAIRTNRGL